MSESNVKVPAADPELEAIMKRNELAHAAVVKAYQQLAKGEMSLRDFKQVVKELDTAVKDIKTRAKTLKGT